MWKLLLLSLFCLPFTGFAASTVACHCFQNRSFDPHNASAADPYFLVTAENSFLALVYKLDKKALVSAKMAGADGDELWIFHEFALLSGLPAQGVEKAYRQSRSWKSVARTLLLDPEAFGPELWVALNSTQQLAERIADRKMAQHLLLDAQQLARCRERGMSTQEMILARLIDEDLLESYLVAKSGQKSWGQLLATQGILDGNALAIRLKAYF